MLSVSQSRVLNFIVKAIHEDQIAPTYQEIADACDLSVSGARFVVLELEAREYLRRHRYHKFRSIRVARMPAEEAAA